MIHRNKLNFFEVIRYFKINRNGESFLVVDLLPRMDPTMKERRNHYLITNTLMFISEIKKYYTTRANKSSSLWPLPGNEDQLGNIPILESVVIESIVNGVLELCAGFGNQM